MSLPQMWYTKHWQINSAIVGVFQRTNDKDLDTITKVHEIAFYIVLQGVPFAMFAHQRNFEKLHGVDYIGAYENETTSKNFVIDISDYLFHEGLMKKNGTGEPHFNLMRRFQRQKCHWTRSCFRGIDGPWNKSSSYEFFDFIAP